MGEIKRFLRDDGAIKVSRSLKENGWKAKKKEQELSLKLGRNPTMEELCESLAMKREEVVMAMDAVSEVDSLYKTLYQKEGSEILLVDKIQSKKDESEEVLNRITLEKLLQELAGRERALIQKRYFEEKTQVQVAKELEMSQVQVSRMEKKILASMRKKSYFILYKISRSFLKSLYHISLLSCRCYHNNLGIRVYLYNILNCIYSAKNRHCNVHSCYIRSVYSELFNAFCSVNSLCNNLVSSLFKHIS